MAKAWVRERSDGGTVRYAVEWRDPKGRRRMKNMGSGANAKRLAKKEAERIAAELLTGNYESNDKIGWGKFRGEYEALIIARKASRTLDSVQNSLDHFEELCKPAYVNQIDARTIDDFITKRRDQRGKKKGSKCSPASVNADLRNLKAALRKAAEWGYLDRVPKIVFEREPQKVPRFVTPEHFALMFQACEHAELPDHGDVSQCHWWRGLLTLLWLTGWRIGEALALRREDLDLDARTALTRFETNKGKRDFETPLHPAVIDQLTPVCSDRVSGSIFFWNRHRRQLDTEFHRLQAKAGIRLTCARSHQHTDACHCYGFHDLRRAFATINAGKLQGDILQKLMRHQSFSTTQRYINLSKRLDESVDVLDVPEFLRGGR